MATGTWEDFAANALKSGLVTPAQVASARRVWNARLQSQSQSPAQTPAPPLRVGANSGHVGVANFHAIPNAELARWMVQEKILTDYQAKKLLRGVTEGFLLGDFMIRRPLASGGSAQVFEARRRSDGRDVALKVLPPNRYEGAERAAAWSRMEREWRIASHFQHPRVAQVLEFFPGYGRASDPGNTTLPETLRQRETSVRSGVSGAGDNARDLSDIAYLVMELIPGVSLDQTLGPDPAAATATGGSQAVAPANRCWSPRAAVGFVCKILEGLEALHASGIIHRDLKPSNIIVTPQRDPVILDLGSALELEPLSPASPNPNRKPGSAQRRSQTQAPALAPEPEQGLIGTLDYTSPEQLDHAANVDARSDLYSLGATLYAMLSGAPPFAGGSSLNKIVKHHVEPPPPLAGARIPADLEELVMRLLAKNPDDRFGNCGEARMAFYHWVRKHRPAP